MNSPEEHLARHEITLRLKKLGATDAELAGLRFSHFDPQQPFDMWALTGEASLRYNFAFCRAYCALRWLIIADPPSSKNKSEAWDFIARVLAEPIMQLGLKTRENQKLRAQKPRAKAGENDETIRAIIEELILKPELRAMSVKELWPHFRSTLEGHGLDPKEINIPGDIRKSQYVYHFKDRVRKISFGRFGNVVSQIRRKIAR